MAKESVESLCQKAQQALAGGLNEQARQLYLQALALRSDAPDVHYGLATVSFLLSDLAGAAYHFKKVTQLDPLRAGAYINLGAVLNRLDQLDDAIPALRRGIQLDMNRAEGYYNLALVYRRKGQTDLAIQAYREATRVNPRMADAHYNLANLYLEKEQYSLAVTHYRQALDLRPTWEKAQRGLEQAEAAQGASERAAAPRLATAQADRLHGQPPTQPKLDPEKVVDPQYHGLVLSPLHRITVDAENQGRQFLQILENEMEPAIKELSTCLLYPDKTITELDQCMKKFETAITNIQSIQASLQETMKKVRTLGDQLFKM